MQGLDYLHSKDPPIAHGDLRCDKIYVNGHSGEIKIGDLGLATLLPYRWQAAQLAGAPEGSMGSISGAAPPGPFDKPSTDIFAFGLCMLELLTLKQLDPQHCEDLQVVLSEVQDEVGGALAAEGLGMQD